MFKEDSLTNRSTRVRICAQSGGRVDPEPCSRLVIFPMKAIQLHKRFTVWQLYARQQAIAKAKAHAQSHSHSQ
jgi:hypothetical protein